MLTQEENDLLTKTGPGTPGGEFLRRYWQPIAIAEEAAIGSAPLPIRIMGEDLVLFRGDDGELGLIGQRCPHRGVDLSYGRVEGGGLRCLYHGWVLDRHGRCLDQPAERPERRFCEKVKHKAYPVQEKGGVIFAYMGKDEPPQIPNYDFLLAPEEFRLHFRVIQQCNWLQALEGSIDPSHVSFLHAVYDNGLAVANKKTGAYRDPFKEDAHPALDCERTRFGVRLHCTHQMNGGQQFLRVTNFLMPNGAAVVGVESAQPKAGGFSGRWYVPIDDNTHVRFELIHTKHEPLNKPLHLSQRDKEVGLDHKPFRMASNRYLQDRAQMKTETFAGLGRSFQSHDLFAIEAQGYIQDRTQELLGSTDVAVTSMRRALLNAMKDMREGRELPNRPRSEAENDYSDMLVFRDYVEPGIDGREYCRRLLERTGRAAE